MENVFGTITKIYFVNQKSGYTGLSLARHGEDPLFCRGKAAGLSVGMPVFLSGEIETSTDGYPYFAFSDYDINDSHTKAATFLMQCDIEGMTEKKAEIFSTYFSAGLFNHVATLKTSLSFEKECPKTVKPLAKSVYKRVKRALAEEETFKLLAECGGSYASCCKAVNKYGAKAPAILISNPYAASLICGASFFTAEALAQHGHIEQYDKRRCAGILFYALRHFENRGDTYCVWEDLMKYATYLMSQTKLGIIPDSLLYAEAVLNPKITVRSDDIALTKIYQTEKSLSSNMLRIQSTKHSLPFDIGKISDIEHDTGVQFSGSQRASFELLQSTGIKILTGGPGTGKTTVINGILDYVTKYYNIKDQEICLCAPTGCAAQHMADKTGRPAQTVHKTLGLKPYSDTDMRITKRLTAKVYIIDEVSMLDVDLAEKLFSAIPGGSLVIMVGDYDQLASVQPGDVLHQSIESGLFETVALSETHRQKKGSSIIENAHKIMRGSSAFDEEKADFTVYSVQNETEAADIALELLNFDEKIQLLCPVKLSVAGTYELNASHQKEHSTTKETRWYGRFSYHEGDRVIAVHNNYSVGYFNGEFGTITAMNEAGLEIAFENGESLYIKNSDLGDICPAYAVTIHKSQGNEFNDVVIVLTKRGGSMLNRNLLYTAVTRAKQSVSIIEEGNILKKALKRTAPARKSALSLLLLKQNEADAPDGKTTKRP